MTPFSFQAVFDRDAAIKRVTYLDADLFFFDNPRAVLRELDESGKHVLITEHAFPPGFDSALVMNGRFCVQFLTFERSMEAERVMRWWQGKCLEWCFDRFEEGRFGDQKYLDCWPELFPDAVHIVRQTERTLAPWNVKYYEQKLNGKLNPVFYHFHGLRLLGANKIKLYYGYNVNKQGLKLYDSYLQSLLHSFSCLNKLGISIPFLKENQDLNFDKIRHMVMGRHCIRKINPLIK